MYKQVICSNLRTLSGKEIRRFVPNALTNHLENKPGEKTEVDWSGPTMSYVDTSTGEVVTVYLFVATLPYSQYSYVEPTRDMKMDTFIRCHVRMYEYFGGVTTRLIVSTGAFGPK